MINSSMLVAQTTNLFQKFGDFFTNLFNSFSGYVWLVIAIGIIFVGIAMLSEGGRKRIQPALPYIIIGMILLAGAATIATLITEDTRSVFPENTASTFITPISMLF